MLNDSDFKHLQRCIELAKEALDKGNQPFGSVLVSAEGKVLAEDHNHDASEDATQHPEFALARWAGKNMTAEDKKKAIVYTSGEHCPMCSAAHGLVGLGKIVYVSSSEQLSEWMKELGADSLGIQTIPIENVILDAQVEGPVPELAEQVHELHRQYHAKKQ